MWELIEEHFKFDYEAGVDWVMQSLRDRWKSFKYKLLNDNFYPNKSKEELLEKTLKNIDSVVDWTAFVHHYNEEKMKKQFAQNAKNRKKLKVSHAGGSKSNARRGCQMAKISEHLPEDQELVISYGVPLKILAHPNDAIEKVFESEHSERVRSLGGNVCPSKTFGMSRNSYVNLGSSSSISRQRVEDLEKQVETLKEKLSGYEETKEKLVQNENHLATLHRFLQSKFGSELPTLN
ncbi:hypothetical protein FXO38_23211 [Capsicum annuum]|nr:hypothetical protein FXO38_23211 [Capsicum annuum]KAF3659040.1 hypothetical protein FXO37_14144 [Capsicum annuum]